MKLLHTCTDNELIRQFQQGYEKAFHVLYERHRQEIFATTIFYIKNYTLAEDLSQEIYIKIITAIRETNIVTRASLFPGPCALCTITAWTISVKRTVFAMFRILTIRQ